MHIALPPEPKNKWGSKDSSALYAGASIDRLSNVFTFDNLPEGQQCQIT